MPFMKFALRKTTNGKLLFVVVSGYSNFWLCHSASRNTPASFQAFMSAILSDFTGVCAFVYLDDILVFSPSEEQHKLDVTAILEVLDYYHLRLNLRKCILHQYEVSFLGKDGITVQRSKVEALLSWPIFSEEERPSRFSWLLQFLS